MDRAHLVGTLQGAWRRAGSRVPGRPPPSGALVPALDWHAQDMGATVDLEDKQAVAERQAQR